MPLVDVQDRLVTPLGRIDLARQIIGIMFHPDSKSARRRRQSALAMTLLGMRDQEDEPDALSQARTWFKSAGEFRTACKADPYERQQQAVLGQVPGVIAVGMLLHLVWTMDAHHGDQLVGGASLNKAVSLYAQFPYFAPLSSRMLWNLWTRYKTVAHFCAAFTVLFDKARQNPSAEIDEHMKRAYDEELDVTLSLAAAYQQFGTTFRPRASAASLIVPDRAWLLGGIRPDESFLPPPLSVEQLAFARSHRAAANSAYL